MLDQLKGLHIEPTNMCTLKCPRCSRTEFIERFPKKWTNQNLNLEHLKSFLDINLKNKIILLNGTYGDPIYYPKFNEMIKFFKQQGSNIVIHTNGSYKEKDWWIELLDMLDNKDVINFSIDGTPQNFTNYRINGDWESIETAIKLAVKSQVTTYWKHIVFSYNEDTIDQAEQTSKELGIDKFMINNGDRWLENDWLKPKNLDHTHTISFTEITRSGAGYTLNRRSENKKKWYANNKQSIQIDADCKKTNNSHYISAWGYYLPCCWMSEHNFYYKTDFFKDRDSYDISKTTLSEILTNPAKTFYNNIESTRLDACTFNCGK